MLPTLRPFTFDDTAALATLFNTVNAAQQHLAFTTPERVAHQYQHTANCDPLHDTIVAVADAMIIGHGRVRWVDEPEGTRAYAHLTWVLPEYSQHPIAIALLDWTSQRLLELHQLNPTTRPGVASIYVNTKNAPLQAQVVERGYAPVRHMFGMRRDLLTPIPETMLPAGLEFRPAQPQQMRAIWEASNEAFADHWGRPEQTEDDYATWLSNPLNNPELWKIVWDGDAIAATMLNFVNPEFNAHYQRQRGYTEDIGVRTAWRRRGIARAMLTASMRMFHAMGMTEAALSVDAQNPAGALRLYESLGFEVEHHAVIYRKPLADIASEPRSNQ